MDCKLNLHLIEILFFKYIFPDGNFSKSTILVSFRILSGTNSSYHYFATAPNRTLKFTRLGAEFQEISEIHLYQRELFAGSVTFLRETTSFPSVVNYASYFFSGTQS
jgi:hypothetical protein